MASVPKPLPTGLAAGGRKVPRHGPRPRTLKSPRALDPGSMSAPVHLYFDSECGPCTLFARASAALGRGRIAALPLAGADADRELASMGTEARFGAFHLVGPSGTFTGEMGVVPLVGLALGRPAERVAKAAPPIRRGLEWTYRRFWRYRRLHGCAAPGS